MAQEDLQERLAIDNGPPMAGPSDAAAKARAYLDLWERHLVQSAVRGRLGPAARPAGGTRQAPKP